MCVCRNKQTPDAETDLCSSFTLSVRVHCVISVSVTAQHTPVVAVTDTVLMLPENEAKLVNKGDNKDSL